MRRVLSAIALVVTMTIGTTIGVFAQVGNVGLKKDLSSYSTVNHNLYGITFLGYGEDYFDMPIELYLSDTQMETVEVVLHEGDEFFLLVPSSQNTFFEIYSVNPSDPIGGIENLIHQSKAGAPVVLRCNLSDLAGNTGIRVDANGQYASFSPYVNLFDSSVVISEGGYSLPRLEKPIENQKIVVENNIFSLELPLFWQEKYMDVRNGDTEISLIHKGIFDLYGSGGQLGRFAIIEEPVYYDPYYVYLSGVISPEGRQLYLVADVFIPEETASNQEEIYAEYMKLQESMAGISYTVQLKNGYTFNDARAVFESLEGRDLYLENLYNTVGHEYFAGRAAMRNGDTYLDGFYVAIYAIGTNTAEKFTTEEWFGVSSNGVVYKYDVVYDSWSMWP